MRAARANRVFRTDEKRIRTENTVTVNTKLLDKRDNALGLQQYSRRPTVSIPLEGKVLLGDAVYSQLCNSARFA